MTLYEANFIAEHMVSVSVEPEGAGEVIIHTPSPTGDGYYPIRSELEIEAVPAAGSGYRFLNWVAGPNDWLSWLQGAMVEMERNGYSSNPFLGIARKGLTYRARFTKDPIIRIESNVDPVRILINGYEYNTPVNLNALWGWVRRSLELNVIWVDSWRGYRHVFDGWQDGYIGGPERSFEPPSRYRDTLIQFNLDIEHRLVVNTTWPEDQHQVFISTGVP